MFDLLKQAAKMKEDFQKLQTELATKTVEAVVGGGMVKVVANGKHQVVSIWIDPTLVAKNDVVMIQDLVVAGVNQAFKMTQELLQEQMKGMTAGLGPLSSLLDFGKK